MKKVFIYLSIISLLLTSLISCDLERLPKGAIDADQALLSVSDAEKWDTGFMAFFRARHRGIFDMTQDIQADQLNAAINFGNNGGSLHGWVALTASDYDLRDVWQAYYSGLKNINKVLETEIPTNNEDEIKRLNIVKGHAHFLRAYYYFNLTIRYGMPYNAATASTDLSVPLVLAYNPAEMPARATNADVYKQILDVDLKAAKELLASVKGSPSSFVLNYDACLALEARVKLFMNDFQGALNSAETLISSNTYKLVDPTQENFENMWRHDSSSEDIIQIKVKKPEEMPNTLGYYGANVNTNANNPYWYPSQWMIDLYPSGDLRKNVYFEKVTVNISDEIFDGIYVISKFKGNPAYKDKDADNWGGYVPNGVQAPKVFRIAEMYLIAAESAFETGNVDKATTYLNALKKSRGISTVAVATRDEIRNERTRELAFEGFRLWDLRRWNLPMKRHNPQTFEGKSEFLSPLVDLNFSVEAGNNKFVWGIPQNDINTNSNLKNQQNPGW